jgi:hypothetical protein
LVDDAGIPAAGAAPQRVADLLRTFSPSPSPARRRRAATRPDAPRTIVPLLVVPDEGSTPLDPGRIDDARRRLKDQAAAGADAASAPPGPAPEVDPGSFDAARSRLRASRAGARRD